MVIEIDDEVLSWDDETLAALTPTERIVYAVDALEPEARSRQRARNVGMSRVFVLLIGMALVLATVVTLNQLVSETMRSIEQGM